jgi:hypothetical protein
MLINLKKINANVVIGILLIFVIIYILYNKKQEVFVNPTLSPEEELLNQKLEELVTISFDREYEPEPGKIATYLALTKEFLDLHGQEVYGKLEELILPALDLSVRILRTHMFDFGCGNSNTTPPPLDAHSIYFMKTIKSLMTVYHEIYKISSGNPQLEALIYTDEQLMTQIKCILKKNLSFDDPKILSNPIILTDESTAIVDPTSSSYNFSIQLLDFIIKFVKGQSSDQCVGVDMNQKVNKLSTYIDLNGDEKTCNQPTPTPTSSVAATLLPTPTSNTTVSSTLLPTPTSNVAATLLPTPTSNTTVSSTLLPTPTSNVAATLLPTPTSNVAATLSPTRSSGTTVTGYDSSVFGGSYSNVTPAPNNLPPGINLTNSQGPNNFFLPNIRIS